MTNEIAYVNLWWVSSTEIGYMWRGLYLELYLLPIHFIFCSILKSIYLHRHFSLLEKSFAIITLAVLLSIISTFKIHKAILA